MVYCSSHNEVVAKSLVDGAVTRITLTPNGVRTYKWSPNRRYIAYTRLDPVSKARANREANGFRQKIYDEDYRQISLFL